MRICKIFLLAVMLMFVAAACENEGPAERLGEKMDETAEEVQEAGKDIGNAIEDACEKVKEDAGAEDTDC